MAEDNSEYDAAFYEALTAGAMSSAQVIVPLLLDLVGPTSVVDVGCGVGEWLWTFRAHGVRDVVGIEGDHVADAHLRFDPHLLIRHDLSTPLRLERRFDLAICLEVAEHLPPDAGPVLVETLVHLAPVILFSAAIPDQGGRQHRNEQWPAYWARHFAGHGFGAVDVIRDRVWTDERVQPWYAQNAMVYMASDGAARELPRALVHPGVFSEAIRRGRAEAAWMSAAPGRLSAAELLQLLPRAVGRAVTRRVWRR